MLFQTPSAPLLNKGDCSNPFYLCLIYWKQKYVLTMMLVDTAKVQCFAIHGISERKKQPDDI